MEWDIHANRTGRRREITREVLKKRDADIVKLKDKLKAQRQEFLGVQKDLESATSDLRKPSVLAASFCSSL